MLLQQQMQPAQQLFSEATSQSVMFWSIDRGNICRVPLSKSLPGSNGSRASKSPIESGGIQMDRGSKFVEAMFSPVDSIVR